MTEAIAERLLAQIYADPASDAPRLVYADWLQERSDPRGELIALQIRGGSARRIAQLLRLHARTWIAPIADVVSEPVFARGFLDACTLTLASASQHELLLHPMWRTVTKIETTHGEALRSPAMTSLRTISGLTIFDFAELAEEGRTFAIEAVEWLMVDLDADTRRDWETFYRSDAFPKVRKLGVELEWSTLDKLGSDFGAWRWLVQGALGSQLHELSVLFRVTKPRAYDWLTAFESRALRRLELIPEANTSLEITRRDEQLALTYHLLDHPKLGNPSPVELEYRYGQSCREVFEGFLPDKAARLTIEIYAKSTQQDVELLQRYFEKLLEREFREVHVRPAEQI